MRVTGEIEKVTVNRLQLLETARKNREEHIAIYTEAMRVYREKVIEALEQKLEAVKNGDKIELWFKLPIPEEHVEDYDCAISMYEWSVDEEVTLDIERFNQLVRNKWGWSPSFVANSASYAGGAQWGIA